MDEENQICPPMIGTFSTHQAQPQVIDIEESSNESKGSNETKKTRTQEKTHKNINVGPSKIQ